MKKLLILILLLSLCVSVFVACKDDAPEPADTTTTGDNQGQTDDLEAAVNYVESMYKDNATVTASDYEVTNVVAIGGVSYAVIWTVDVTAGSADDVIIAEGSTANSVKVDINEKAAADVAYTLTATVADATGNTKTVSFNRTVPAYKVNSWSEYVAAEKDANLVIQGVVTGIISKSLGDSYNCLYLQDNDGGYYAYALEKDPITESNITVGMKVQITGVKDIYSGTQEIKNGVVEIIDSTVTTVAPTDYTAAFTAATELTAETIVGNQALLVTLKNVEVTGQDTGSGYYMFKLGTLESYVRISSSVCPLNAADTATFIKGHGEHLGWIADVTGVICVFDGKFYLTPVTVDAFNYINLPTKTDAEMVAFEKENLSLPTAITADAVIDLAAKGTTYDAVNITWASDNAAAVVADNKLTITVPDAGATVKITATLTAGSSTDIVEFTINLLASELSYEEIVNALYALEAGASLDGTYRLYGEITSIDTAYSEQYKNITVTIVVAGLTDKPVQCFRLKGDDAATLAVGDKITVEGKLKNYNGTFEFDSGCLLLGKGEIVDQSKTVLAAYALASGEAMATKSVLQGVISKIDTAYSEQYKNITVTIVVDGLTENPIMCFRLKGENAATLAVGDKITVIGTIKNYSGTIEFDSGCEIVPNDMLVQLRTLLSLYQLPAGEALSGSKTLTGVISSVDTAYSAQYKNVTVTIVVNGLTDYPVQCFRLKGDAAETIKVGDTITVTGTLKNYNGTFEFDSGCTLTQVTDGGQTTDPDPVVDPNLTSATYNFATSSTKTGSELNADTALALFKASTSVTTPLTSTAVTKIYDGTGTGGGKPNIAGILKTGTGTVAGQLVLTFADGWNVTKVEIKCHDFYIVSTQYPSNSNTVAVNGSTAVLAPYTAEGTPAVLSFDLTNFSNIITIDFANRVYVYEVTVYFTK